MIARLVNQCFLLGGTSIFFIYPLNIYKRNTYIVKKKIKNFGGANWPRPPQGCMWLRNCLLYPLSIGFGLKALHLREVTLNQPKGWFHPFWCGFLYVYFVGGRWHYKKIDQITLVETILMQVTGTSWKVTLLISMKLVRP